MRSSSSGTSRKTEKRIKVFLLLFALILGILISLESRTHFMRLQKIEISPIGMLPTAVAWKNVSHAEEHLWLLLLLKKSDYEEKIESRYPVDCKLRIAGWGKLQVKLQTLEPIARVEWNGKYWYISEDGKIWPDDLKVNSILTLDKIKDKPVLFWSNDRITPFEIGNSHDEIKKTALPIDQIMEWQNVLASVKWLDKISAIKTEDNDGISAVRLIFKDKNGNIGGSVLLPWNTDDWVVSALAINKICPDLTSLSQSNFIDATYKGKILVKNGVQ